MEDSIPNAITDYFRVSNIPLTLSSARLPDCPLVLVNAAFTDLTGYTEAESIGHNCRFLQIDDSQSVERAELRQAIEGASEIFITLLNYRKSGSLFVNHLFLFPIRDQFGEVVFFMGSQCDITQNSDYVIAEKRAALLGEDIDQLNRVMRDAGRMAVDCAKLMSLMAKSMVSLKLRTQDRWRV